MKSTYSLSGGRRSVRRFVRHYRDIHRYRLDRGDYRTMVVFCCFCAAQHCQVKFAQSSGFFFSPEEGGGGG